MIDKLKKKEYHHDMTTETTTFADKLIEKYNLKKDSYYPQYKSYKDMVANIDSTIAHERGELDAGLYNKYKLHIPEGWCGFDLGYIVPTSWFHVIDEFIQYVIDEYPNMEIQQIKIKFGSIRIYLGNISEYIDQQVFKLEKVMSDKNLIW